ncbi:MAG: hypothetical protein LBI78_00015 [Campylobacteraceae bacterium]|nr:hypothetical protein [Campylobacteraceae bacterium]
MSAYITKVVFVGFMILFIAMLSYNIYFFTKIWRKIFKERWDKEFKRVSHNLTCIIVKQTTTLICIAISNSNISTYINNHAYSSDIHMYASNLEYSACIIVLILTCTYVNKNRQSDIAKIKSFTVFLA